MKLFREKPGIISEEPVWVLFWGPYMHINASLLGLAWEFITEYQDDRHLIG